MVNDIDRLQATLSEELAEKKKHAVKKREENEREFEAHCQAEIDEKLRPLIEKQQKEINAITETFRARQKEIHNAKWEDNRKFLEQQELIKEKEQTDAEEELAVTKSDYEEQIRQLNEKEAELDAETKSAEECIKEIYSQRLQLVSDISDIEVQRYELSQTLEAEQKKEKMRMNEVLLEKTKEINRGLESKQKGILQKNNRRQAQISNNALVCQKTFVEVSLLNISSDKIIDVNTSINEVKSHKNQIETSFDEMLVHLNAMDRARGETNPKIKNSTLKLTDNRLKSLSKLLGDLCTHLDNLLQDMSKVGALEKMAKEIEIIKNEVGKAQTRISEFRSFLISGQFGWEDGKLNGLTESMKSISEKVDALKLLENDKKKKQETLMQTMTDSQKVITDGSASE